MLIPGQQKEFSVWISDALKGVVYLDSGDGILLTFTSNHMIDGHTGFEFLFLETSKVWVLMFQDGLDFE
jgi:hypothetical protein